MDGATRNSETKRKKTMKRLALDHDVNVITFDPPPAGFDIQTATDAQLKQYGFPADIANPKDQARYAQLKEQLKGRFHYVAPTFRVNPEKVHGLNRKSKSANGAETSGNWSGAVVYAPAGQSFKWIEGDWVVPNVSAPTQNSWYYSASWIGIDGDGSPDVCQAGVECEVYQSGGTVTRHIYPWFEWYPLSEVQITNFAVSPGDMITMLICTSQAAGSTNATVYFTNRTSGASTSVGFNAPSGTKLVGNSAEWIVEAPTVNGSQSAIADFGEVFFSVCEAVTNSGATVDGGTGDTISLVAAGKTVAAGALITPTVVLSSYAGALP
jgi:hypothetical protein